jgi:hypothetical protein
MQDRKIAVIGAGNINIKDVIREASELSEIFIITPRPEAPDIPKIYNKLRNKKPYSTKFR